MRIEPQSVVETSFGIAWRLRKLVGPRKRCARRKGFIGKTTPGMQRPQPNLVKRNCACWPPVRGEGVHPISSWRSHDCADVVRCDTVADQGVLVDADQ